MSLAGNNSNSGTSGRSSIFETFHTPNFGDETFEVQPVKAPSRPPEPVDALPGSRSMENPTAAHHPSAEGLQRQEATTTAEEEEEEYALDEEEDVSSSENAETTLWMSCSPGRDLTDDEVDEEWGESTSQEMDEMNEEQELDDEEKSSEGDDDDEDDGVPLSKLARKQFIEREPIPRHPTISRKTNKTAADKKAGSKKQIPANSKKKKKLKLVKRSSYSFFYSDTQNAIKSQNPAATFGEISKIVASMWDHLGSDLKEEYSRRAEEFNAQHKDEILLAARSKPKKAKKSSSSSSKSKHRILDSEAQSESLDSLEGPAFKGDSESKDDSSDNVDASSASFGDSRRSKLRKEDRQDRETKTKPICNYTKCQNPAVDDPRWEYNYCSPQCVISHCKDVFKAWVANRKSAYCET